MERYHIHFLNGDIKVIEENSFTNAIIMAMAWAIETGRDKRIKGVVDSHGLQVNNVCVPSFQYAK